MGFKRSMIGSALAVALAAPLLAPSPAEAWWARPGYGWHGGWGWHSGWGWRGGVFIGGPAVVGPPVAYAPSPYHWVRGHYTRYGAWAPPHWGYY